MRRASSCSREGRGGMRASVVSHPEYSPRSFHRGEGSLEPGRGARSHAEVCPEAAAHQGPLLLPPSSLPTISSNSSGGTMGSNARGWGVSAREYT